MKQEIWKWVDSLPYRLVCETVEAGPGPGSAAANAGYQYWDVFLHVVGGVTLERKACDNCGTAENNKLYASQEIQHQLAAQGVRCEIRRVKR